jgi:hypothetical protein
VGAPAVPCRYDSADEYIAVPDGEEQFGVVVEEYLDSFGVICRAAEGRGAPELQDGVDVVGCAGPLLDVAHGDLSRPATASPCRATPRLACRFRVPAFR